jgi:hypothetical protein
LSHEVTLFVFGAGATRGCSFVDSNKRPCLPPLDRDFFTQLQRIRHKKHQSLVTGVIRDVVRLFGTNFDATMENVFTTVEHTRRMIKLTGGNRDFNDADLEEMSNRLRQAIAAVFEEALCRRSGGRATRDPRPCSFHGRFVREHLKAGDAIVSFNYDCVLDFTLKEHGLGKWNPHRGYGFKLRPGGRGLTGDKFWEPKISAAPGKSVRLLKLHGSLHFKIDDIAVADSPVNLKNRPYTKQKGQVQFSIIPPEWHKRFDEGVFGHLWKQASDAIYEAEHIVFVGYSLPVTDLHSTALFRTSVKTAKLKSLVIVNPDRDARRRTRAVLQRGLNETTRVLSFDSLAEFVAVDRAVWSL